MKPSGRIANLQLNMNRSWHVYAVSAFMAMVVAHLAEHAVQAFQIFILGWARPESRGLFGQWLPWLVTSESLHYLYAILTLVGIIVLLPGFVGRARFWWLIALLTQSWHHFEHALLLAQRVSGTAFFGEQVPTSVVQIWLPRVELHLFYNAIVAVPLVIAVWWHIFPSDDERARAECSCSFQFAARPGVQASEA